MGRPSKFTAEEWNDASRRIEAGETYRSVANRYGVAESAIRKRISAQRAQYEEKKALANQLVTAENKIKERPISTQVEIYSLADDLRATGMHLAGAAKYGSATAHRLAGIANAKVQEIDDAAPLNAASLESLKGVAVLTRMANDASNIGLNLLAANKEAVNKVQNPPKGPSGLAHFYGEDAIDV